MSRRIERLGRLIRDILADAIQNRLADPRIEPLTSITRVDVAPDLSLARVHLSIYASESRKRQGLLAVRRAGGRLRSMLARELEIRKTPELDFRLDDSLQKGFQTVQAVDQAMAEYGPLPPGTADEPDAPGLPGERDERSRPADVPDAVNVPADPPAALGTEEEARPSRSGHADAGPASEAAAARDRQEEV